MKNILIVCSGNSIRSQIAEGFVKALAGGKYDIKSAGVTPVGIHPMAVEIMNEVGIDISGHGCTMLSRSMLQDVDYLITLCNSARDHLPAILPGVRHIHRDVGNPDRQYPSEDDRRKGYARVRHDILNHIETFLDEIEHGD